MWKSKNTRACRLLEQIAYAQPQLLKMLNDSRLDPWVFLLVPLFRYHQDATPLLTQEFWTQLQLMEGKILTAHVLSRAFFWNLLKILRCLKKTSFNAQQGLEHAAYFLPFSNSPSTSASIEPSRIDSKSIPQSKNRKKTMNPMNAPLVNMTIIFLLNLWI